MERTTAFGLWRYAKEFFEAAKKIQELSTYMRQKYLYRTKSILKAQK